MEAVTDVTEIRSMSSRQLVDKLAEHEDMDDVIEAELQRRSMSRINLMTWASWAMMTAALAALTLSSLYLTGVINRPVHPIKRIRQIAEEITPDMINPTI